MYNVWYNHNILNSNIARPTRNLIRIFGNIFYFPADDFLDSVLMILVLLVMMVTANYFMDVHFWKRRNDRWESETRDACE